YLWALASVTLAALNGGALRALLAGVMAALAVHCNITYGVFVPVLAAHYLVVYRSAAGHLPRWRQIAATAAWGATGAVGITAVLSAIILLAGREALFFALLLDITLRYTADTKYLAGWWSPWRTGWYWSAFHLALPTAMAILSPVLLYVARRSTPIARTRE